MPRDEARQSQNVACSCEYCRPAFHSEETLLKQLKNRCYKRMDFKKSKRGICVIFVTMSRMLSNIKELTMTKGHSNALCVLKYQSNTQSKKAYNGSHWRKTVSILFKIIQPKGQFMGACFNKCKLSLINLT